MNIEQKDDERAGMQLPPPAPIRRNEDTSTSITIESSGRIVKSMEATRKDTGHINPMTMKKIVNM